MGGLLFAAICFACWKGGDSSFANFLFWYRFLPVILILFLIGAFQRRKQLGGYLTFKEALAFAFLAYVVYEIFYAAVTVLLFNIVDPHLQERLVPYILSRTRESLEKMQTPTSDMSRMLEDAKKDFQGTFTPRQIILGFGMSVVYDFAKSVIIALITQRKNPGLAGSKIADI
jgi:hypothetical protein